MEISAVSSVDLGAQAQEVTKSTTGAQVVTKTLEYMQESKVGIGTQADQYFQKSVLNAAYSPVGKIVDKIV